MGLLSVVSFGFMIILTLNLGVLNNKCTNLNQLEHDRLELERQRSENSCKIKGSNKDFPWQKFDLPGESIPLRYEIFLNPDPNKKEISGSVSILFKSKTNAKYVVLHGTDMNIRGLSIAECHPNDPDCHPDMDQDEHYQAAIDNFDISCPELSQIAIKMRDELKVGPTYKLNIKYSKIIDETDSGITFWRNETSILDFSTLKARTVIPCFDEPHLVADFKLRILRKKEQKILVNADFERKDPFKKSMQTNARQFGVSIINTDTHELDEFEVIRNIPPFRLGLAIGQFKTVQSNVNDTLLKVSGSHKWQNAQLNEYLDVFQGAFNLCNEFVRLKFKYETLRQVFERMSSAKSKECLLVFTIRKPFLELFYLQNVHKNILMLMVFSFYPKK